MINRTIVFILDIFSSLKASWGYFQLFRLFRCVCALSILVSKFREYYRVLFYNYTINEAQNTSLGIFYNCRNALWHKHFLLISNFSLYRCKTDTIDIEFYLELISVLQEKVLSYIVLLPWTCLNLLVYQMQLRSNWYLTLFN